MKSQFFLLATVLILTSLLFLVNYRPPMSEFQAKSLGINFENEIVYIVNHFNYTDIGDFVGKFKNYLNRIGFNITYTCWANTDVNLRKCINNNDINCCYYYKPNQIIKINTFNVVLYPVKSWVCFQYTITGYGQKYENFFCT